MQQWFVQVVRDLSLVFFVCSKTFLVGLRFVRQYLAGFNLAKGRQPGSFWGKILPKALFRKSRDHCIFLYFPCIFLYFPTKKSFKAAPRREATDDLQDLGDHVPIPPPTPLWSPDFLGFLPPLVHTFFLVADLKDFLVGKYRKIPGNTRKIQENIRKSLYFLLFSLFFLVFSYNFLAKKFLKQRQPFGGRGIWGEWKF